MSEVLVVVDVQNDFVTGSLAVTGAKEIIPKINKRIKSVFDNDGLIIYTQDCHKLLHPSFVEQGGEWPPHCVAGTEGQKFYLDLLRAPGIIVQKAFYEEEHSADLRPYIGPGDRVVVVGIALEICVRATAIHCMMECGAESTIIDTACTAAVGNKQELIDSMVKEGLYLV